MPEFKKNTRGFKMKGFTPFTKKTDPPKNQAGTDEDYGQYAGQVPGKINTNVDRGPIFELEQLKKKANPTAADKRRMKELRKTMRFIDKNIGQEYDMD